MKAREKATGSGIVWDGFAMNGYRAEATTGCSSATMIFGDWSSLVIGEWGVLEIQVNPYADFQGGTVRARAFYSVDIGLRNAAAFAVASSIT
jgi:hypothetical protein